MEKFSNLLLSFKKVASILIFSFFSITALLAQDSEKKFDLSILQRTAKYDHLNLFLGKWRVLFVSYVKKNIAAQGKGSEDISYFDNAKYLNINIKFEDEYANLNRHGIMTYNPEIDKFTYYFIDYGAVFPIELQGDFIEKDKTFIFTGKIFDYENLKKRNIKIVYKFENDNKIIETRYWTDTKKDLKITEISHIKVE